MRPDVDQFHRRAGSWRGGASSPTSVKTLRLMVRVRVHIEQGRTDRRGKGRNDLSPTSLAHVDDAFQHRASLSLAVRRLPWTRSVARRG